jgi:hypothetical protein
VFKTAITQLTFTSAKEILFGGDSIGATNYLKSTTSVVLSNGFRPIIDNSFVKVKVSAFNNQYTVKGMWAEFASKYNVVAGAYSRLNVNASSTNIATSLTARASLTALQAGGISAVDSLNTDIVDFATGKALNGLFFMVGRQETKLRKDPVGTLSVVVEVITGTVSDLLKKVFTSSESDLN